MIKVVRLEVCVLAGGICAKCDLSLQVPKKRGLQQIWRGFNADRHGPPSCEKSRTWCTDDQGSLGRSVCSGNL